MARIRKSVKLVQGFLRAMQEDHVGAYAAQSAYFIMLSFIPVLILLLTLVRYTPLHKGDIYFAAMTVLPESMDSFLLGLINEVYSKTAVTVSLSAIVTAWSAGRGFLALMNGMNTIYKVEEHRNYFLLRLRSALYTVVFILSIILSLVVLVFGTSIHQMVQLYLPLLSHVTGLIVAMKGAVAVVYLTLIFMFLYKFVPDRRSTLLRQAPGALFSAVCWYLFSNGFSIYMDHSAGFSNMYGSLTTIVMVMIWLYFCMYIVLLGAEVNSYFEEQFRRVNAYRKRLREERQEKKA